MLIRFSTESISGALDTQRREGLLTFGPVHCCWCFKLTLQEAEFVQKGVSFWAGEWGGERITSWPGDTEAYFPLTPQSVGPLPSSMGQDFSPSQLMTENMTLLCEKSPILCGLMAFTGRWYFSLGKYLFVPFPHFSLCCPLLICVCT